MAENPKGLGLRRRTGEEREPVTLLELLDFLVNADPFKIGCKVCRDARYGDDDHAPTCDLVAWRDALVMGGLVEVIRDGRRIVLVGGA